MNKENSFWVKCEVVLVFLALLVASVYSNNDMVERVAVPSAVVLVASVLMLIRKLLDKSVDTLGISVLLFSLAASYFVVRAMFSPVQGLATSDLLLMLPAYLTAVIVSQKESRKLIASWLPWFAVVVVAVQSVPVFIQLSEPNYIPFREPFKGKIFISGFFGHQNFFAALMGICGLGLLSYGSCGRSVSGRRQRYCRCIWIVVALWAFSMLYLSSSRGAWVATSVGLVVLFVLALVIRVLMNRDNIRSSSLVGAIGILAAAGIVYLGSQQMAENRAMEDRGFFFSNARTDLLALAADCEPNSVLLGGGSRFYLYENRRVWDYEQMNNTLGDPRFVHNEYIESMVNYGYLGMVVFVCVIGGAILLSGMQLITGVLSQKNKRVNGEWLAMHLSVLGVIVIVAVQSLVDFTLHVLPLTMLAGLAVGLLLRSSKPKLWCGAVCMVMVSSATTVLALRAVPTVLSLPSVEKAKDALKSNDLLSAAEYYEKAAEISGHFDHYNASLGLYTQLGNSEELLQKRRDLGLKCYDLYPEDGMNLTSLVRLELLEGRLETALTYAVEAVHWVGQTEGKFGANILLAEVKFKLLQRDERLAAKTDTPMSPGEFEKRLLECWAHYQDGLKLGGRVNTWTKNITDQMRAEYLLRSFFKLAMVGEDKVKENKMSEGMTYIQFARSLYSKAKKIQMGVMDSNSLERFERTTLQMDFFKKFKVTIDSNLLKQLEQELVIR